MHQSVDVRTLVFLCDTVINNLTHVYKAFLYLFPGLGARSICTGSQRSTTSRSLLTVL